MQRAIFYFLLAALACLASVGCDTRSTAKLILTLGLNIRAAPDTAETIPTAGQPLAAPAEGTSVDELVAAMGQLNRLPGDYASRASVRLPRLTNLMNRLEKLADEIVAAPSTSGQLFEQTRELQAAALARAAEIRPGEFSDQLDNYCQTTFGYQWDRTALARQAVSRLVNEYVMAAELPDDAASALALQAVTFPRHPVNVDLYCAMSERIAGEEDLLEGLQLARSGLAYCADHPDIGQLEDQLKRIYRDHPGEIGVPMNFAGPTHAEQRFTLSSLRGRPVLVVFWSMTDPASDEFMVSCQQLASSLGDAELQVVGVSLNATIKDLAAWRATHGISCPNVFSPKKELAGFQNPIASFYQVTAVPAYFLLDRDGIVIARGANDLSTIEDALRQLQALNPRP